MIYQVSIIKFPTGRYGYVGSVPAKLGKEVKATKSDVMGGRAYKNAQGEIVTVKFPSFETENDARTFAASVGVEL